MIRGNKIEPVDEKLNSILTEVAWTSVTHSYALNGIVKICLYFGEKDLDSGKLKSETRRAMILDLAGDASLINQISLVLPEIHNLLDREEILVNHSGEELFV